MAPDQYDDPRGLHGSAESDAAAGHGAREDSGAPTAAAVATMVDVLAEVRLGQPMHHHNLTLFPLFLEATGEPAYVLLSDAISRGDTKVMEVSVSGSVPDLAVVNHGDRPVLVPEGEILSGAKQNRVVNVTVLVAPMSTFALPVSCVERGRWRRDSDVMAAAGYAPPDLRTGTLEDVNVRRSSGEGALSDQGRVWAEVDRLSATVGAHSPTDSLSDVLDAAEQGRVPYREAITIPEGACGFVAGMGGNAVGVELFGSATVMAGAGASLAEAYFAQAAWSQEEQDQTPAAAVHAFLESVAAGLQAAVAVGDMGVELAVDAPGVVGQALVLEDQLCRLAAFRRQGEVARGGADA